MLPEEADGVLPDNHSQLIAPARFLVHAFQARYRFPDCGMWTVSSPRDHVTRASLSSHGILKACSSQGAGRDRCHHRVSMWWIDLRGAVCTAGHICLQKGVSVAYRSSIVFFVFERPIFYAFFFAVKCPFIHISTGKIRVEVPEWARQSRASVQPLPYRVGDGGGWVWVGRARKYAAGLFFLQ